MSEFDLSGLVIVGAIAFTAPLLLGLAPAVRLPAVVLELVAGIIVGPSLLGWVEIDVTIEVLALVGLAFLLFLSGLEIDFDRLRPPARAQARSHRRRLRCLLRDRGRRGARPRGIGQVDTPLFVAIVLVATSLGVVVPVLKDSGNASTDLGQLVIAAASIADFGAVILLSLFFSREATGTATQLLLLGASCSSCSPSSLRCSAPSTLGASRSCSCVSRTRPHRSKSGVRSCS